MRRIIALITFLAVMQTAALAQTSTDRRGWGYAAGGIGATTGSGFSTATFQVAGGGEGLVYKGLGLGAEIGYLAPIEGPAEGFGIFSPNVSYHFQNDSKLVPFVTGGYSVAFRQGASHGGNFGGGVHYWVKERVGLRFEFRDHIFSSDSPHFFQFRVGVSFR